MRALPLLVFVALATPAAAEPRFDRTAATRFADLALACVHKEYPNKIAHVLESDADVKPARELTPAFYGCYDWHSAVHGHWLLARLARTDPEAPFAAAARAALARSLTPANVAAEVVYLERKSRGSFERPYGLAWLLQLAAELREWDDPQARELAGILAPLEHATVRRLSEWLPKLSFPVRSGEHSQSAFALGLMLDYSRSTRSPDFGALVEARVRHFYLRDTACPLAYEPSGEDFVSPCLAEADVVRRVLPPPQFATWLTAFLPQVTGAGSFLPVAVVTDRSDGKLAHLDGLNLSRAWMLEGIASGLPGADGRRATLLAVGSAHRASGLASVTGEHYEGGHWLGSFATYLVTGRGLAPRSGLTRTGPRPDHGHSLRLSASSPASP